MVRMYLMLLLQHTAHRSMLVGHPINCMRYIARTSHATMWETDA
jgi:hypothetical protein